jgi:hypothetical protein
MTRYLPVALLAGACRLALAAPAEPLPPLGADLTRTTVSGLSSGAFMAAQLATAYSARFIGVGVIAGGPYYCAGTYPSLSLMANATTTCMSPPIAAAGPDANISWINANQFAEQGLIDPVSNIGKQTLYAFSGSADRTVKTIVVDAVEQYYLKAGVPPQRITYDKSTGAGHAIVTRNAGIACGKTESPYINNCDFDQADVLLRRLYGAHSRPARTGVPAGRIVAFAQSEFVDSKRASMDATAYVYVPRACERESCAVHVALHGCQQGASRIGDLFYGGTGYNQFADTNRLIVLYPQAVVSTGIPANPQGCWDFWGYSTNRNVAPYDPAQPPFFAKGAPQMAAIVRMIDRLGTPRGAAAAAAPSASHP